MRSEKVRTYNFPQDRVTDHRASVSSSAANYFMNGENTLHDFLEKLLKVDRDDRIKEIINK